MRFSSLKSSICVLVLAALAACGGASSGPSALLPSRGGEQQPNGSSILARIVGVGDSLTAGYQANGFLGKTGIANRLDPGHQVPPGQENGWWALLDEQASGESLDTVIAKMYDPATSPLPLIKGPGLDNQIVRQASGAPIGQLKSGNICTDNGGFNEAAYHLRGSARVLMNPASSNIRDFGVPGMTAHEAVVLHQPQTSTCKPLPGIPGLLSDVVAEESETFWPVLRNFTNLGGHLTAVNAAASLHPTLATVWIGANDVLKYMGSGGRFVGGDRTPGQAESDVRAAISTFARAGAHVVVANLPNIVETGFFQRITVPQKPSHACKIRTYAYCFAVIIGGVPTQALTFLGKKYGLATPGGCIPASVSNPCGYLTLPGTIELIQYYETTGGYPDLDCATPAPHCKSVPGSGLGMNYITPEFAGKVQALNNAINRGIDDAASASHVPLVDIQAIFHGLASGNPSNQYFHLASSVNPGICCTLGYFHQVGYPSFVAAPGGLLSFDGIHPSNTGYALVANAFIEAINKAYGTSIRQVDVTAVYNGTRCSNKNYCFKDPYAPH